MLLPCFIIEQHARASLTFLTLVKQTHRPQHVLHAGKLQRLVGRNRRPVVDHVCVVVALVTCVHLDGLLSAHSHLPLNSVHLAHHRPPIPSATATSRLEVVVQVRVLPVVHHVLDVVLLSLVDTSKSNSMRRLRWRWLHPVLASRAYPTIDVHATGRLKSSELVLRVAARCAAGPGGVARPDAVVDPILHLYL